MLPSNGQRIRKSDHALNWTAVYVYQPATKFLRVYDSGGALHRNDAIFKGKDAKKESRDWVRQIEKTKYEYHRTIKQ